MEKRFKHRVGSMHGKCKGESRELFPYQDLMNHSFGMSVKIGNQVGLREGGVGDGGDGRQEL